MTRRGLLLLAAPIFIVCLNVAPLGPHLRAIAEVLPVRLEDEEYWQMVQRFSERAGSFPSDNLLSNERSFQDVIPELMRTAAPHAAYVGVGPEQNFTYIAVLKPKIAFIVDIRRGNLDLHLMYKALFELSADRAEFVSKLFSKPRPDGLTAEATAKELFDAYAKVETDETSYVQNLRAIVNHLVKTHGFTLSADDMLRLQRTYRAFYTHGPAIQYSSTRNNGRRDEPTYRDLMLSTDGDGQARGFLASEEAFAFVKRFEIDNLLVPVIGNFAGPRALRAVGEFLTDKSATVAAFYVSNVEEYLRREGTWKTFCSNVTTLPLDPTSVFIRSVRGDGPGSGFRLESELGAMAPEVSACR
jgi:hypothetical protein